MKHLFIIFLLSALAAWAGGNDVILDFGLSPDNAAKQGHTPYTIASKGVTLIDENGFRFYRLKRDTTNPAHRAAIRFHAPKTCTCYHNQSFNVSLMVRTQANRRNGCIMAYIGYMRIDFRNGRACVVFLGKGKKFPPMHEDTRVNPNAQGAWTHVHVNVDRLGDIALYINGKLNVKRNIADRTEQPWMDGIWWTIDGFNRPEDLDNPIATMDVARLSVREGLMSMAQIDEEAMEWLAPVRK